MSRVYKLIKKLISEFNKQKNKMFRQKIDEVTNCSCRLLPNQPNQYAIFKTQISHPKVIKEPKQKFSLKSQVASSAKQQSKVPSAQKTSLKAIKLSEDQKQCQNKKNNSINQKLQKNVICSPENSQIRKVNEPITQTHNFGSEVRSFTKIPNGSKTAQNNKLKVHKKCDTQRQEYPQRQQSKSYMVANFSNQPPSSSHISQVSRKQDLPKKSLNFQDYYKYVSNPYAAQERNKENVLNDENPQTLRYKIDLRMKKQCRRLKNESVLFQDFNNNNVQTNIFHQSLQKYDNTKQNIRGTATGSLVTKNSIHSHNDSIKGSKNQLSMVNSKLINLNDNPSLKFNKMPISNHFEHDHIQQNKSEIFFHNNPSTIISSRNRNPSFIRSIIGNQPNYVDNVNSIEQKLLMREVISCIERPQTLIQNQQSEVIQRGKFLCGEKGVDVVKKELVKLSPVNKKMLIKKMSSFTDIINNTADCESVLGEGENSAFSNEESIVIMRYKDLVEEVHGLSEFDHGASIKQEDLQLGSKLIQKQKQSFPESSNILTTIKPTIKGLTSLVEDSTLTCDQNMKKTLKFHPKNQYFTQQFSVQQ